ncbi:MAG: hypothetical protein R3F56_26055 [Planctomycetota bacterium]
MQPVADAADAPQAVARVGAGAAALAQDQHLGVVAEDVGRQPDERLHQPPSPELDVAVGVQRGHQALPSAPQLPRGQADAAGGDVLVQTTVLEVDALLQDRVHQGLVRLVEALALDQQIEGVDADGDVVQVLGAVDGARLPTAQAVVRTPDQAQPALVAGSHRHGLQGGAVGDPVGGHILDQVGHDVAVAGGTQTLPRTQLAHGGRHGARQELVEAPEVGIVGVHGVDLLNSVAGRLAPAASQFSRAPAP